MAKKFKPKKRANKGFMECDICERVNLQFRIHLKKERFSSKASEKERNARQVCFNCGFYLFRKGTYNFSFRWRETFLDSLEKLGSKESNKEKYLVIHK